MSITGIPCAQLKELRLAYPSAALFDITFINGTTINVCTAFDNNSVGLNFGGTQYTAAVVSQEQGRMQVGSNMAVSGFGTIAIGLADPDGRWTAQELTNGFLGATMTVWQCFWDPNTITTSADRIQKFFGICDPAVRSGETLMIRATSNYALAKILTPPVPVQHNCPWTFPTTYGQRLVAAEDLFSIFFNCGYSPDITGGAGTGNYNGGTTPFTDCPKTKVACQQRGMWDHDSSGRQTSRYGGSEWEPPATWKGRSYTAGKTLIGINSENIKKYKGYIPLTYGTTWSNGQPFNVVGDPNSTRFEVAFGYGNFALPSETVNDNWWAYKLNLLLVSGSLLVPYQSNTSDLLFRWYGLNHGSRNGYFNPTAIYSGNGDPYGSMLTVMVVVYSQIQSSGSAPSCQALLGTRPIPQYTGPGVFTYQTTDLVAWVLYDLIHIHKPDLWAKIDVNTVYLYAGICAQQIAYNKTDGTTGYHRRFGVSISIEQAASLANVIEGIKVAGRVDIVPKANGDGYVFQPRATLAVQQGNPVNGSNNNTPYPSYLLTDNPTGSPTGTGFVAYDFDDSNILLGTFSFLQDPIGNIPCVLEANIQDEDNQYTPDTVSIANLDLYNATQQLNRATIQGLGFPNYAQAYMCLKTRQAELSMGNPRGDSRGTMRIQFEASVKSGFLSQGQIIRVKNTQLNLGPQYFRIEAIGPAQEFQDFQIVARWHEDQWYTDQFAGLQQAF